MFKTCQTLLIVITTTWLSAAHDSASAQWRNSLQPTGKTSTWLTLADNGKTNYTLIIPSKPSSQDRKAADDLAHWLGQMTGAKFPVAKDSTPPRETEISIGHTNRLEQANLPVAQANLEDEGYALAVQGKKLFLLGGQRRGAINAVYALLEEDLGCRWFPPSNSHKGGPRPEKEANRIPRSELLRFQPVQRSYVPPFIYRAPAYTNAYEPAWALRNRSSGAEIPEAWGGEVNWTGFCHEMGRLVPATEYFDQHPEYFSMTEGKRTSRQLCMTNPEVTALLTEKLLERLRETPDVEFADVSPNDGGGHCQCPDCSHLNQENGGPAGSQIYFVNKVAEVVSKEFPKIRLVTAAYMDSGAPPTKIHAHKNVAVFLANDGHSWVKPLIPFTTSPWEFSANYREAIQGWARVCNTLLIWDYFCNFQHYLAPMPNLHVLEPSVRYYAQHNVKGVYLQGSGYITAGEFAPLRAWVMAKSLWDPSRNVDDLIEDFVWGYYGQAAPAIQAYRQLLDRASTPHRPQINSICFSMISNYPNAPFLTREFLAEATEIFAQAEKLPLNPTSRRRLAVAKLPLGYVKLCKATGITDEPWQFRTDEDYASLLEEFKAVVKREKITHYAEGVPMAGWLAEKEALHERLPKQIVADLFQSLDNAQPENCRMLKRTSVQEENHTHVVILQHPPNEGIADVSYEIALPKVDKNKQLVFRFGTCFAAPTANGVGFTVLINGNLAWSDEQQELTSKDHQIDLSPWQGKTTTLTLRVDALGDSAYDWSCWVRPQIEMVTRTKSRQ